LQNFFQQLSLQQSQQGSQQSHFGAQQSHFGAGAQHGGGQHGSQHSSHLWWKPCHLCFFSQQHGSQQLSQQLVQAGAPQAPPQQAPGSAPANQALVSSRNAAFMNCPPLQEITRTGKPGRGTPAPPLRTVAVSAVETSVNRRRTNLLAGLGLTLIRIEDRQTGGRPFSAPVGRAHFVQAQDVTEQM
jgi:hypothetical protein